MIVRSVLIIIVAFQVAEIQANRTEAVNAQLRDKEFFVKINGHLHITLNKIFKSLKLLKSFSKTYLHNQLLKMHNDLNNIFTLYWDSYYVLRNITATNDAGPYKNVIIETYKEIIEEGRNINEITAENKIHEVVIDAIIANKLGPINFYVLADKMNTVGNISGMLKKHIATRKKDAVKVKKLGLKIWRRTSQPPASRRLFQAQTISIKEFPFMASVHVQQQFICSGAVIGQNLVLTAASCLHMFYEGNPKSVSVRVASDFAHEKGVLLPAAKIFFHPEFEPSVLHNNLAIIKLKNKLLLRNKEGKLRRIDYDRNVSAVFDDSGASIAVLGWGEREAKPSAKKQVNLSVDYIDVYDLKSCVDVYSPHYVTNTNFCTGYKNKGTGACNRDVGGAGVLEDILVGIISFGSPKCGMKDAPTVFTRISHYSKWIDHVVGQDRLTLGEATAEQKAKPKNIAHPRVTTAEPPEPPKPTSSEFINGHDDLEVLQRIVRDISLIDPRIVDFMFDEETEPTRKPVPNKSFLAIKLFSPDTKTETRQNKERIPKHTAKGKVLPLIHFDLYKSKNSNQGNDKDPLMSLLELAVKNRNGMLPVKVQDIYKQVMRYIFDDKDSHDRAIQEASNLRLYKDPAMEYDVSYDMETDHKLDNFHEGASAEQMNGERSHFVSNDTNYNYYEYLMEVND